MELSDKNGSIEWFVASTIARQENQRTWAAIVFTAAGLIATMTLSVLLVLTDYPWAAAVGGFPIVGIVALFLRITGANRQVYLRMLASTPPADDARLKESNAGGEGSSEQPGPAVTTEVRGSRMSRQTRSSKASARAANVQETRK